VKEVWLQECVYVMFIYTCMRVRACVQEEECEHVCLIIQEEPRACLQTFCTNQAYTIQACTSQGYARQGCAA